MYTKRELTRLQELAWLSYSQTGPDAEKTKLHTAEFDKAIGWVEKNILIRGVELRSHMMMLELAFMLDNDLEVLSLLQPSMINIVGGFVDDSNVLGKTIADTRFVDSKRVTGTIDNDLPLSTIIASNTPRGITIHGGYPMEVSIGDFSELSKKILRYVHPHALDALTKPNMPPTTWKPALYIERITGKDANKSWLLPGRSRQYM